MKFEEDSRTMHYAISTVDYYTLKSLRECGFTLIQYTLTNPLTFYTSNLTRSYPLSHSIRKQCICFEAAIIFITSGVKVVSAIIGSFILVQPEVAIPMGYNGLLVRRRKPRRRFWLYLAFQQGQKSTMLAFNQERLIKNINGPSRKKQ